MNSLGKTKLRTGAGHCRDLRLDRHNSGALQKISATAIENKKMQKNKCNLDALLFLSQEAIEMIDSILQPYCEDFLTRQSVIEYIDIIIANEKSK